MGCGHAAFLDGCGLLVLCLLLHLNLFNQSAQKVLHQESFHEPLQSQSHSLETQGVYGYLVPGAIGQNTHL